MPEQTDDQITVAALVGSLRPGSYTAAALRIALQGAGEFGAKTKLIDLRDYDLPFENGGASDGAPDVARLRADIKSAQGLLIGTPEYHGSFSGVLKNALDFLRFEEMEGKMIGLVGVAGGAMGAFDAMNGLRAIGRALHAWVLPAQVAIPEAWKQFDDEGAIRSAALRKRLHDVGFEVAKFAYWHNCGRVREFIHGWETAPENPGGGAEP